MRKCKCWQVKIFPQKSWFSQKLHSTILKILQCFTKPDRPSSESPAALPAGARDAWHDLSAIRLLKRSQLSSLCSIAFFQCPLCLSQCHWRHLGDQTELHLAVLGEISSVSLPVMFARLAGWQLVVPGKSSSTARLCLKMWGICLNTAFHQTLDFFSEAVRSSNCCPFVLPFRYFFFYFISLPCKGNLLVFLGLAPPMASCVCFYEVQGMRLITEPLSFCSGFLCCTKGAILRVFPISPVWLSANTSQALVQGSSVEHTRSSLLLPSPQTMGSVPDSREISAVLPIDVSGAKISPCRKDQVLPIYRVNVAI